MKRMKLLCCVFGLLMVPLTYAAWSSCRQTCWVFAEEVGDRCVTDFNSPGDRCTLYYIYGYPRCTNQWCPDGD